MGRAMADTDPTQIALKSGYRLHLVPGDQNLVVSSDGSSLRVLLPHLCDQSPPASSLHRCSWAGWAPQTETLGSMASS